MEFKNVSQARRLADISYLGSINSSAKIIKNQKVSNNYTYILYLAPASTSGFNVCSHSTPECRKGCLATSGRASMDIKSERFIIHQARIKKTRLFHEQTEFFMQLLIAEIEAGIRKAQKDNYDFSVRLNGTSDIDWNNVFYKGQTIFEIFSDVQFYDYTKNPSKLFNTPKNYHLTLSYTGYNWETCEKFLKKGVNVAMVFKNELPKTCKGYKVINGDLTDYRPTDEKGTIVGLKYKKIADNEANEFVYNSVFVVDAKEFETAVLFQ